MRSSETFAQHSVPFLSNLLFRQSLTILKSTVIQQAVSKMISA
jgi:hypothetical protein